MLCVGAVRIYPRQNARGRISQYPVYPDRGAAQSYYRYAETDDPLHRPSDQSSHRIKKRAVPETALFSYTMMKSDLNPFFDDADLFDIPLVIVGRF